MTSTPVQVRMDRIYAYDNGAVAPVAASGSFETNTAIWTTAAPRARAGTHSPLSDALTTVLPGMEEAAQQSGLPAGKYVAYGSKVLGKLDDAYGVGQHLLQGNGAETVTAGTKVGGGLAGAYTGAKVLAPLGTMAFGPPGGKVGAVAGVLIGGFAGGEAAEALGEKLTGGPTPDKLGPPLTLPSHLKLEPTVTTAEGDRYALVSVEGKYSWFSINDNPLLFPNRYVEVVRGAKVSELTRSYLDAAGFPEQAERHNAELAEQQRSALREQFRRSETQYTNSLGPDGQPWGTPTPTAPNATTEWARSPQPGFLLHTTRINQGAILETRIVKEVDLARWQVESEHVYERGVQGQRLVGITNPANQLRWSLDRSSGEMQRSTLTAEEAAQARMAPAVQNHRALSNPQLQQCHRDEAERFTQSMKGVAALATGQAGTNDQQRFDPQQRDQAIEEGMGQFRRANAELLSARQVMRERGMEVPEVADVPELSRLRERAQQQEQQQAQASVKQAPELTALQQRHQQLAQHQLEPAMREHGYSTEQIERVSAAAVSHVQQVAHRGPAHTFMLSRDGASVAVLQERAPMSEFSVQEAQRQSPQQHLEQAHALAQQQEQSRVDSQHEQRQVQHGAIQRSMA